MSKMPFYAVASGRSTGVYDNWEDCKDQVNGYSHNNYKKFDTPDKAWDYVDKHSSNAGSSNNKAYGGNNQVALRDYGGEVSYQRTDYTEGRNSVVVRDRLYRSGRDGNGGQFVEKGTRTYWKNNN
ncbi:PREDICTED: ribonuclease H-like isoform X2 [Trachymyrmex cornetzi]|uniref:ribonuclease H-like isoform X2 n=1 Tax=Trachymyrmex cornetzi TaxID=471704 RepID=UPI00084EFF63|nr:PREDICTED: ribonuclease H-like isoform X2 [Trachymyrmex cornetzi]